MSRRTGQDGYVERRNGMWRGRYLVDVPGQFERIKRAVVLGFVKEMSKSAARRKLKETIAETGINSPRYRIPSTDTFARQVEQWMGTTVAKCKVSTQKLRRYHTDVYLLPKWGKSAVECITPKVVNEWLIAPELKHLAPETLKGIVSTLQAALGRRFPRRSILYPSQTEVEDDPRCYSAEEVEQIVDAATGQWQALRWWSSRNGSGTEANRW